MRVDSRCLGPRDFGGGKPKQLLEALLVQRGRFLAKDQLAEMIWGEALPRRVAMTIESYVSLLRSRLGAASGLIATERGGYRAELGGVEVDVDVFDSLVRDAAGASVAERRQRLEAALAIAAGELLEDEPYAEWAMDLRRTYAERRLQATCDLAESCLALDDAQAAVELAERALVFDPLLERAHRVAIAGHYTLGEEGRALRAYERCRVTLVRDLVDRAARRQHRSSSELTAQATRSPGSLRRVRLVNRRQVPLQDWRGGRLRRPARSPRQRPERSWRGRTTGR